MLRHLDSERETKTQELSDWSLMLLAGSDFIDGGGVGGACGGCAPRLRFTLNQGTFCK